MKIFNRVSLLFILILTVQFALAQTVNTTSSSGCTGNTEVVFYIIPGSTCGSPTIYNPSSWSVSPSGGVTITPVANTATPPSYLQIRVKFANAGTYSIHANYGCSGGGSSGTASRTGFQVNPVVTPSVSITSSATTICQGATVNFSASPTHGGASPSYQWQINGANVAGATSSTFSTTSLNHGNQVQVRLTSSLLCASSPSATSLPITMTVNTPSVQTIVIESTKDSVCPGEGIGFFVESETNIGASPTYQWFVNGNPQLSDVPGMGPKHFIKNSWNFSNNAQVTCRVTSTGCLTNNPATSNPISVPLNSLQTFTAGISILPSRYPLQYCPGEIYFQASASHSISSYTWYKNGSSVGTGSTYVPESFITGDVVSLTVNSNASCLANTSANATTSGAPITIKSLVSVGNITCDICSIGTRCQNGGTTQFNSSVQNSDGVTWSLENAGSSSINSSGLVTWATEYSGTATIRVTATGCGGPQSTTKNIVVIPQGGPVAIGITANKSSVCNGEGITFMVTSEANVGSSPVYEWFVNGQPRSSDVFLNAKTLIINNWNYPNNYAVTCRVTSSIACTPNNPATSDAIPISIIPSQTFTVGISILPSKYPLTYCEDEISFQANPSHPVTSYAWTKNGSSEILSTSQTYDPVYFQPGDYVTVTAYPSSNACLSNSSASSSTQGAPLTIYTNLGGVTINTPENSRCQGSGTSQFTYSGTVPSPFTWNLINAGTSTINQSGLVTWDANFSGTVTIQIRLNSCPSIFVNKTFTVNAQPPIPLGITQTNCAFEAIKIKPTPNSNTDIFELYSNANELLATGRELSLNRTLNPGTHTFKLGALSIEGCNSPGKSIVTISVGNNCDEKLNWIETSSKNHRKVNGSTQTATSSNTRAYFDLLGKSLQAQVRSLTENQILSSASVTDGFERPVLATLSAPLNQTSFQYKHLFLTNQDGDRYDHQDINAPLGDDPGTVGWYYSNLNPDGQIPKTEYPFSLSDFYQDGSGDARMAGGPGVKLKIGSGHEMLSGSFPVINELNDYLQVRNTHVLPGQTSYSTLKYEAIQQVVRDQQGRYAVSFSEKSGKSVMTARPGTWLNVTNTVTLKANDAALRDRLYFYKLTAGPVTLNAANNPIYSVTDLVTNATITPPANGTNWPAGFYLISLSGTGNGTLDVSYSNGYGDISYNFYDDAGRLVSTISPNGYQQLKVNNPVVPYANIDKTTYQYNYRGWLLSMTEPDAGRTEYMYRSDGKIRFSQNALQRERNRFSYTHYDELGRPIESGEYKGTTEIFNSVSLKEKLEIGAQAVWTGTDITDWVKTYYDESHTVGALAGFNQTFLRGAVSASENANIKTWYSYDEQGRVKWMVQKPLALSRYFVVKYEYDFSGKVEKVEQFSKEGSTEKDRFFHHYEYDADQRLSVAYTSVDGITKKEHARYLYYLHGPLRRIELAQNLQGIDFVYNIHGWLESINHPDNLEDPGNDGQPGTHSNFKKDVFGLLLDYYDSEFGTLYQGADAGMDLNKFHGLNPEKERAYTSLSWFRPKQAFNPESSENSLAEYSAENPFYRNQIANLRQQKIELEKFNEMLPVDQLLVNPNEVVASSAATPMFYKDERESPSLFIPNYQVVWKDLVGVTDVNGIIFKPTTLPSVWGNAGAASQNVLPANTDGYIEFTASSNNSFMVGFSTSNADAHYNTIHYAIFANSNSNVVYLNGVSNTSVNTVFGDIIRIERVGSSILFKKNGTTFYTKTSASTASLIVDASVYASNTSLGPVTTSFWIPSTPVPNPSYDVVWTDLVGVSVNGNTITKTAASGWGNAGGASVNQLPAGIDGWTEMTVPVSQTTGSIIFGLSDTNPNADYASIDYAIYPSLVSQGVYVFENGTTKTNVPYAAGDVFRVERIGTSVYYKKNGTTFYTSTIPSTSALIVDAAINNSGHVISNAKASFWIPPAQGLAPDIWEFAALKELYDSLGGANWTNKSGWPASGAWPTSATPTQMDAWFGIEVQNGDISAIYFANNNLAGKIPTEIGNLKGLRSLVLAQHTNLIGSIPASVGNLSLLQTINLNTNKLAGAIPGSLNQLTNLRTLHLGNNLFTGNIPVLSALTNLSFLDLSVIPTLTLGPLPSWLGNLTKLETFYMYNSARNGSIPSEMQNMVSLKHINWSQNQLTGSVPIWFANLTNLITVYLNNNQLSGPVGVDFSNLVNLENLALYSNQLSGSIPATLNAAPKLKVIWLHYNQFSGEIPYLGDRSGTLTQLNLGNNPITPGPIPAWIGNLTKLGLLSLDAANRTGAIPTSLSNLTELSQLHLQNNQLTGNFPAFLASLPKVAYLYVFNNQLTGPLPVDWSGAPMLYYLQCSSNKLTGAIPASLINLPSLTIAYFTGNDFTTMPNFSTKTNKASFLLRVDNNRIDFTTLEPNFTGTNTHPFSYFVFAPQKTINDVMEYSVPVNQQLEIPGRPVTGLNTVVWEKWNGSSWVNVNASNQNATGTSYRRTNAVAGDAGSYRFRITSSKVTSVTLQSEPIVVGLTDAFNQTAAYLGNALYNGNITALSWRTDPAHAANSQEYKGMFIYRYDDKYQLQESQFANPNFVTNTYTLADNKFRENGMTYDPNGNLLTLKRYTEGQHKVHDFTYNYQALKSPNLVANADATSTSGYTTNGGGVTLSTQTSNGQSYVKTTVTSNTTGIRLFQVNVAAGEKYTFRVQGYETSVNGSAYVWISSNLGGYLVWNQPSSQLPASADAEGWVEVEVTLPAGTTQIFGGLMFGFNVAAGESLYVNRVELFKSQARSNRLASVTGYVNTYAYNAIGQMTTQDNVTGTDLFVNYDVTGKVTHVFSDAAKSKLTTRYLYDDRGFRLTKETYNTAGALQFTTWYIRDASGNVMSTYEQQAGQSTILLTEIPVYGSGKLGLARTKLDGSFEYIYEMTDHLGNVRATIKASDDVYLATMEDTGVADWTNPRVREMAHFKNLFETEREDSRMNHTPETVVAGAERSAYLFWINDGIAATREDQVGPAIALQVDKGDSLSLETWAKFERKVSYNRNATTGMLADLLGSVFVNAAYGLETATQAKQIFNTNLSAALGGTGADPATRPYAYLNYLIFDDNYVVKDGGAWRVPDNAGFDPGMEISVTPQQVKFPSHIKPQQKGYIYIWVSNESENTKVWFDDLKVTHTKSRVVQASDYYAWGSTMREQRTPENPTYRYGYQGQFAEKDLETGWNHFKVREYDPIIGRWMVVDPARQFHSPYLAYNNNPVNLVDPDGAFVDPTPQQASKILSSFSLALDTWAKSKANHTFLQYKNGVTAEVTNVTMIERVEVKGIAYKGGAWDRFMNQNTYGQKISFTFGGKNFEAKYAFINSDQPNMNVITDVLFYSGKEGRGTVTGAYDGVGFVVQFLGPKGRLVGMMEFKDKESFTEFSSIFKSRLDNLTADLIDTLGNKRLSDYFGKFRSTKIDLEMPTSDESLRIENVKPLEEN